MGRFVLILVLVTSIVGLAFGVGWSINHVNDLSKDRKADVEAQRSRAIHLSALSQLQNCQQIEQVKAKLLATVNDSVKGRHLSRKQRRGTDRFRKRFAPTDCYL